MITHEQKKGLVDCLDRMADAFMRGVPVEKQNEIEAFLVAKDRAHFLIGSLGNQDAPAEEKESHDAEESVGVRRLS